MKAIHDGEKRVCSRTPKENVDRFTKVSKDQKHLSCEVESYFGGMRATMCGILYRRARFVAVNMAGCVADATCLKCVKAHRTIL
jgi:hypothetical protein